jgi:serine/threonine protein kinase
VGLARGEKRPGDTIGRYRVERELGRGSMGRVYLAEDPLLRERVCIKVLHPDLANHPVAVERFLREVVLARRIAHPNVCRIFDLHADDGMRFLTMEFIEGTTLAELLDNDRAPIAIDRALRIMGHMCEGLGAAHAVGVVHRDLKPRNIMMRGADDVTILDFGIATSLDALSNLTRPGVPVGTHNYIAPEVWAGLGATPRSDVFAAGVVLFNLLTRRTPWPQNPGDTVYALMKQGPPKPPSAWRPDVPKSVDDVVLRALAFSADDRFPDALALADACHVVERALHPHATSGPPSNPRMSRVPERTSSHSGERSGERPAVLRTGERPAVRSGEHPAVLRTGERPAVRHHHSSGDFAPTLEANIPVVAADPMLARDTHRMDHPGPDDGQFPATIEVGPLLSDRSAPPTVPVRAPHTESSLEVVVGIALPEGDRTLEVPALVALPQDHARSEARVRDLVGSQVTTLPTLKTQSPPAAPWQSVEAAARVSTTSTPPQPARSSTPPTGPGLQALAPRATSTPPGPPVGARAASIPPSPRAQSTPGAALADDLHQRATEAFQDGPRHAAAQRPLWMLVGVGAFGAVLAVVVVLWVAARPEATAPKGPLPARAATAP